MFGYSSILNFINLCISNTFLINSFNQSLQERQPPLVDDFLYVCDDSYTREQLIHTEIKILEAVDFDLGIPLSYRFLRRYARVSIPR